VPSLHLPLQLLVQFQLFLSLLRCRTGLGLAETAFCLFFAFCPAEEGRAFDAYA
jgi:hypothetical protein